VQIASTLRTQADVVAHDAINRVHADSEGIIAQLAPRLAAVVDQSIRAQTRTARMRVILGGAAALAIGLALVAGVSYAAGSASGRTAGEMSAHTVAAAMAAGPDAAAAWGTLMAANDPVQALAACKKSVSANPEGRRYCSMPVWLDPPDKAVPGR